MIMAGPSWVANTFAFIVLLVAAASAVVLVGSWAARTLHHADIDVSHLVMGVAMAGMLTPSLAFGSAAMWRIVFAVACVWFGWRTYRYVLSPAAGSAPHAGAHRHSHYVVHLVMVASMLYMFALPGSGGGVMDAMSSGGVSARPAGYLVFSLLFLIVLMASAVWELDGAGRVHSWSAADVESGAGGWDGAAVAEDGSVTLGRARVLPLASIAEACHIAMCVAMGYMLVVLL
jgi:hypothetical protein